MFIIGTEPSVLSISNVHNFEDLAPRGNLFRSNVIAPETEQTNVEMKILRALILLLLLLLSIILLTKSNISEKLHEIKSTVNK